MNSAIKIMDVKQIKLLDPSFHRSKTCESILRGLPQWFGIETSLMQYVEEIKTNPTLFALVKNEYVGFLSYKQHNKYSADG